MSGELTPEQQTIHTYNANPQEWVAAHSTPGFWSKQLEAFHHRLPSGKILEIGAGGGRDSLELMAMGYDYTGIEPSNMIDFAQRANPLATFIRTDIDNLDFPDSSFDGFWASAVLLHIPRARVNHALLNIARVVRPKGVGFISLKEGVGEHLEGPKGLERNFSFYLQPEFETVLKRASYKVLEADTKTAEETKWLTFIVEVNK